ncbi:hypothetical protein [Aureispira anguillae]|uniref:Uncharacterized protein n=1 Tax=Aureispira anguillae TaxID=2864201 RepID=A0A915YBM9_9BACT|nr:hypothetical protein [Aureispira anguillae]BDS10109.1 hypothetical protein AsAng_0008160 [Aureispira anguillae]
MVDKQKKEVQLALQYIKENRTSCIDVFSDAVIEYFSKKEHVPNEQQRENAEMTFKSIKDILLHSK